MNQLVKLLKDYKNIGIYLSLKDEVNTSDYLAYFLENFESVSSSVVEDQDLVFYQIKDVNDLKVGYNNILEPAKNHQVLKNEMEAIIVPLVGFDKNNNRLGFGQGYYDRYLADYKNVTIGLAFDDQQHPHLPRDEWDVKLDYIITESRIFKNK